MRRVYGDQWLWDTVVVGAPVVGGGDVVGGGGGVVVGGGCVVGGAVGGGCVVGRVVATVVAGGRLVVVGVCAIARGGTVCCGSGDCPLGMVDPVSCPTRPESSTVGES